MDEHINILKSVIEIVNENSFQPRYDKCKFLYDEITYLGYTVNSIGIRPNEENLKAISNFPVPINVK